MARPVARMLALLEVLQSGGTHTVAALAARLDVDERTVRRYVTQLVELEVPVRTVRGRYGGYRIAPGHRVPPLMLTDEEALAVLLGLLAGRRTGLTTGGEANRSAAAKVRRVLPEATGRRLDAVLETTGLTAPATSAAGADTRTMLLLAEAARDRRPVAVAYTRRDGGYSERTILPYGIVAHSGRWYVTGHDSRSGQLRTFRVDRISRPTPRLGSFNVPPGFDPVATVLGSLADTPWRHEVSIRVHGDVPSVRAQLPSGIATVEPLPDADGEAGWVRVRLRAERLDWVPAAIAGLDREFVIEKPDELLAGMRALAERLRVGSAAAAARDATARGAGRHR